MFAYSVSARRIGMRLATFGTVVLLAVASIGAAQAETRNLRFYNLHTHEKGIFPYKVNGRYVSSELKKINYMLRDWRKNKAVSMDPQLLDLIWEAYRQSGSNGYINIICGYRSPATNNMLRSRSSGVAQKSQHTLGKALDFFIPGVPLKKMREIGLRMQVGGVGYYPTSGSPFVHFDVGRARHWPRMNRSQLLAVFPRGNTVHVPSDGKPLPGYQQALASYKQRRGSSDMQVANAGGRASGGGKTLLSFLFGGGADEAEDDADEVTAPTAAPARSAPATRPSPVLAPMKAAPEIAVAAVVPQSRPNVPGGYAVAVPDVFDTSRSEAVVQPTVDRPGPIVEPRVEPATQLALLQPARVPFPTIAPSRQSLEAPTVPSLASAVAQSAVADEVKSESVSSLMADLQAQDERQTRSMPSEQLAYAVPTPRDRPSFEAALDRMVASPSTTSVAVASKNVPSKKLAASSQQLTEGGVLAADAPAVMSGGDAGGIQIAAKVSAPVPSPTPNRSLMTLAAASKVPVRNTASEFRSIFAAAGDRGAPAPSSPEKSHGRKAGKTGGKGGRVLGGDTELSGNRLKVAAVDPQDFIASRIEMASLVTDRGRRPSKLRTTAPAAARLVGNLPDTLYADGFSPVKPGAAVSSFSGSAVTFMPVVKIKP